MPKVLIVGGGILGTTHAIEAINRGFAVEQFEATPEPHASTARSLGALHFSWAADGLELDLSRRAARAWKALGGEKPAGFVRQTGSFAIATNEFEREVLTSLTSRPDATERGWTLLDQRETTAANPALTGDVVAALYSKLDMLVDPRAVLRELLVRLRNDESFWFHGGREIRDFSADSVTDATGRVHRGDLVILCPGMRSDLAVSVLRQPSALRRVQIQVAQTEPLAATMTAPVSDVAALQRNGLIEPALAALRDTDPLLGEVELRLNCVQRPGGTLIVGDARRTEEPFDFEIAARPTDALMARLKTMLGRPTPSVVRQWTGTVRECLDGRLWYRDDLDETVALIGGTDQRGVTLAPVIAKETFDWLLDGIDSGATHPSAARA